MQQFEAVVFDMDGVIFDSEREIFLCWEEVARKHGVRDIDIPLRDCLGVTANESRQIMKRFYGEEFPYDLYSREASVLFHEKNDGGRLPKKPGIDDLLHELRRRRIRTALASSTRRESVEKALQGAGFLSCFDAVICGDMVQNSKPDPEIYLTACRALGTAPESCFAIEDSYNGIRSAAAGGLRPLMVPDLMPPTPEMESLAERILPDLSAVQAYLFDESRG